MISRVFIGYANHQWMGNLVVGVGVLIAEGVDAANWVQGVKEDTDGVNERTGRLR